jgi:hypothetical protein
MVKRGVGLRRGGVLAVVAMIGLAGACGGTAVVTGPGGEAGASSMGGATAIAGASASAGADACSAAQASGECEAYIPSFWHNPATGLCEPFVYGGCGGNANRYPSREACQQACANIQDDWDECVDDSNCTLVYQMCCGPCNPTVEDVIAINTSHQSLWGTCSVPTSCGPCLPVPETEQSLKYFKPKCQHAHCTLIDIRETALTACETTSDCTLRDGVGCCPECDGAAWVAVNENADLCPDVKPSCGFCISPPPQDWEAVCIAGQCRQVARP